MLTENILTENIEDYASRLKIIKEIEIMNVVEEINEIDQEIEITNVEDLDEMKELNEIRQTKINSMVSNILLLRQINNNNFTSLYRMCGCCKHDKPASNFIRENFDICFLCKLRKDQAKLKYHCQHNRLKYRCKECKEAGEGGSSLCCHLAQKNNCKLCKEGEDSSIHVRRRERDVCPEHNQILGLCALCIHRMHEEDLQQD